MAAIRAETAGAQAGASSRLLVFATILCALAMLLAGCSGSSSAHTGGSYSGPKFTGPYADQFKSAWVQSKSPFVRRVIADQKITDQEWAEVGQRLNACLAKKDLTFKGFRADGSYAVGTGHVPGDQANADLPPCERQSGERWLGFLRQQMATNPNNTPIPQLMAACLIRLGAVAPGYSGQDYLRDAPAQSFPYIDGKAGAAKFLACNSDPTTGLGK